MKRTAKFVAHDGQHFDSREECKAHEDSLIIRKLVGMSYERLSAAIAGDDEDLANAIEEVGSKIGASRRKRGDMKRKREPAVKNKAAA